MSRVQEIVRLRLIISGVALQQQLADEQEIDHNSHGDRGSKQGEHSYVPLMAPALACCFMVNEK